MSKPLMLNDSNKSPPQPLLKPRPEKRQKCGEFNISLTPNAPFVPSSSALSPPPNNHRAAWLQGVLSEDRLKLKEEVETVKNQYKILQQENEKLQGMVERLYSQTFALDTTIHNDDKANAHRMRSVITRLEQENEKLVKLVSVLSKEKTELEDRLLEDHKQLVGLLGTLKKKLTQLREQRKASENLRAQQTKIILQLRRESNKMEEETVTDKSTDSKRDEKDDDNESSDGRRIAACSLLCLYNAAA
jgi:hypothetical protein